MIVHAHPAADSLNRALVAAAITGLAGSDAAHAPSPPISASLYDGDDPTADDLRAVETLVFVYPTWWGGPPAMLLDWIERRLGPWIDGAPSEPSPLSSVRRLAAVTTHGSPRLLNRVTGEPGRRLLATSVRSLCAPGCRWQWIAYYGVDADDDVSRADFVAQVPADLRSFTR